MGRLKRHLYLLGQQTRDHVKMVAEFPSVGRRSLQRVGFAYLLGLVLLTVLFFLVRSLAPPLGLSRSFYASLDPGIAPLFEARATTVDLAFVDDRDDLPTQFHRVRWDGIWFSPRQEVVEFRAGADDSVVVTLDGEEVLRRNPRVGMHAVSRAVTLDAGPHRLELDYEQGPGGRSLNVQWAPASGTPGPLYPGRLFDHDPGWSGFWLATVTIGLQYVVVLAWRGGP